nr:reverse transcriptase domain-containing protein [Tanacetum cinerariifolium]
MFVEVGKFTFPADFVIMKMEEDSKVSLILGRHFLYTGNAVIRVKQKQLNLGVGTEQTIFHIDSAMKHSYSNDDTCFSIDVIEEILEEYFDALLDKGSEILHSIEGTILKGKLFVEFDELMAMTLDENFEFASNTKEAPFEIITFNTDYKIKTSLEEPPTDLELKLFLITWNMYSWKNPLFFRPLTKLLDKDTPFEFDDECHNAFKLLKEKLVCAPVIVSPNCNLPFELVCDASDFTVGAILVFTFDYFQSYLILSKTIVHTDHLALRHLFKKQYAKPRLIRWILLLKEFDIEIKDTNGTKNAVSDHLSSDDSELDDNFLRETLMEINTRDEPWFANFANYLVSDIIPKEMTYQQKNKFFSDLKHYFWKKPYLFRVCSDGTDLERAAGTDLKRAAGTDLEREAGTDLKRAAGTDLKIPVQPDLVTRSSYPI